MNPQAGEILIFNKPYRWTSFNVVAKVRGELSHRLGVKKLKVGHAGTLDPLATGVLIICTGKSTKLIDELQAHTKEYVATIKLGATTPSFDMETAGVGGREIEGVCGTHRTNSTYVLSGESGWKTCLQVCQEG